MKLGRVEISEEPLEERLTSFGGLTLLFDTMEAVRLEEEIGKHVRTKKRDRGFTEAQYVRSLIVLNAIGGECVDDLRHVQADEGIAAMAGHGIPSPEAARKFLLNFHSDELIQKAKDGRPAGQLAFIPTETGPLEGLSRVNEAILAEFGRRRPTNRIATVDQDATIIESRNSEAMYTYKQVPGYQPQLCTWAETGMVLVDEYRDGNANANMSPLQVARRAFEALPAEVTELYYRSDSQGYNWELMNWLRDPDRVGRKGSIRFAISADMSKSLRECVEQIPEEHWVPWHSQKSDPSTERRMWADVSFTPSEPSEKKDTQPLRYVAIRILPRQGGLFADGSTVKHFAVVTNWTDIDGEKLIRWHRERAGVCEQVNDILKNEFAAGVAPSKEFGVNAAWLRIACLTHNLFQFAKIIALPAEFLDARPKRLRFLLFSIPGRIVSHARNLFLKLASSLARLRSLIDARSTLRIPVRV